MQRGESPRALGRVLGLAYLVITACGVLGVGFLDGSLQHEGDHAATAAAIEAHTMTFRFGVASVLVIYASVLVAAWAMYLLLQRVDRCLALLGLIFRIGEAIVGFVTIFASLGILELVRADGPAAALGAGGRAAWVGIMLDLRTAALDIVLSLIGVGGTVFLLLLWRSRLIPRWLSAWGVFTYLSMLCMALLSLLYVEHPRSVETALYGLGAAFEGVFGVRMLWKGVDASRWRQLSDV